MSQPNHPYVAMPASEATESIPVGHCRTCGLAQSAHGQLADHPEELKLRKVEQDAAETLKQLARKAARALEAHERVDAVVLLTQLEVVVDNLRKGMVVAINDQMKATREASNGG